MVTRRHASRSGQALIEMGICMLAFLVVIGMLAQIGLLGRARTRTLQEATAEATEASIRDSYTIDFLGSAEYIHEVETGDDTSRYSADDEYSIENVTPLMEGIVVHADPGRLQGFAGPNRISGVYGSGQVINEFNLVRGHDRESVRLLEVVRGLMYQGESIEVENEVFMPWLRGMY